MDEATPWPPRRRRWRGAVRVLLAAALPVLGVRVVLFATGLAVLGMVLLLILPGAFILGVSLPVFGLSEWDLHADAAWPIGIALSLLWPVGLVLGYWVGFGLLKGQSGGRKAAAMAGVAVAWCLLLSLLFYAGAEKRKPAAHRYTTPPTPT